MIFFDHTDLTSAGEARGELQEQIAASLTGTPDNPISDGMRLAELQGGNAEEQTLALLMDRVQRLAVVTENIDQRLQMNAERNRLELKAMEGLPFSVELKKIRERLAGDEGWREELLDMRRKESAKTGEGVQELPGQPGTPASSDPQFPADD